MTSPSNPVDDPVGTVRRATVNGKVFVKSDDHGLPVWNRVFGADDRSYHEKCASEALPDSVVVGAVPCTPAAHVGEARPALRPACNCGPCQREAVARNAPIPYLRRQVAELVFDALDESQRAREVVPIHTKADVDAAAAAVVALVQPALDTLRWLHAEAVWHAEHHRVQADTHSLALALQRAGFRSMKDQVDAMARQIKALQAQLDQAIKGEQLARLRRYVHDLTESVPDISGDDNLSTEDAYNRGYADADVATGKALGALLDVKFNEVLDSPEFRAALERRAPKSRREATTPQWESGDIALDHTNFVHRRFEHGWRVVGRECGVQYDDESMETALGPLLRLASVPDEVDVVGAVPVEVAERLRADAAVSASPREQGDGHGS